MACLHKSVFTAKAPSTFHGAAYWVRRTESAVAPEKMQVLCFEGKKSGSAGGSEGRPGLPHQGSSRSGILRLFTWGSPAQTYFSSSEPVHLQHFPPQQAVSKKTCSRNFSYPFDRGEARFICKKGPARPARALVVQTKGLKADPHSRVCPAAHHRVALESATLGSFVRHPTKLQTRGKGTSFSQDRDWGTHTNVALQEGVNGVWLV